jgi:hypothetical protein
MTVLRIPVVSTVQCHSIDIVFVGQPDLMETVNKYLLSTR